MAGGQGDAARQPFEVQDPFELVPKLLTLDGSIEELGHGVEPGVDRRTVHQRPEKPGSQQPAAHGRQREVDDVQERIFDPAVAEVPDELQIPDGGCVQGQKLALSDKGHFVDERQGILPDFFQIGQKPAGRGRGPWLVLQIKAGQGYHPEMPEQHLAGLGVLKGPILDRADQRRAQAGLQAFPVELFLVTGRDDDFLGRRPEQFVGQQFDVGPGPLGRPHLAAAEVDDRQPPTLGRKSQGGDERAFPRFLGVHFHGRPGRQDLDHVALNDTSGRLGVFHLLANGHPEAAPEELGDVGIDGMEGNAAHRNFLPGGQGDVQHGRAELGVLVEHLVKIAQPEQEQSILVLLLNAEILVHHRRE